MQHVYRVFIVSVNCRIMKDILKKKGNGKKWGQNLSRWFLEETSIENIQQQCNYKIVNCEILNLPHRFSFVHVLLDN